MKVICDHGALQDAVNDVARVVPSRAPRPEMQGVRLEAGEDGLLSISATDSEVGLRLVVDRVEVAEPGAALVPADKLAAIVRSCDQPTLTLKTREHQLDIDAEGSHFAVFGFDPAAAPDAIRGDVSAEADLTISAGELRRLIDRTVFAAAVDNTRYAIAGVLFDPSDKRLRLVATDGRRLAVATGRATIGDGAQRCIVPSKALGVLGRLLDDPEADVTMRFADATILFQVGEGASAAILETNLVEGSFPPFEDVIPKEQDRRMVANVEVFSKAVSQAALLTNNESKGVKMSFDGGAQTLTLSSRVPEMGEAEITLPMEIAMPDGDSAPFEISFHPGFLTDALKVVDAPEVMIELKSETKPGVLRAGSDFTYVVMPMQL